MQQTVREPLRIAQVAPLYESVPPKLYGGTERVVSYLTEELVRQGHDVTLFASADSKTSAQLVPVCPRALRLDAGRPDPVALHLAMLEQLFRQADEFDLIHFHTDGLHLPLARRHEVPSVTTLHGRLDLRGLDVLYREFSELPLVSISDAQRQPLAWANWAATVYHGLPLTLHRPTFGPGRYLAFLGRVSPEKRLDRAIEIARRLKLPLKIAAKVDAADRDYFRQQIEPLIGGPLIEFLGEITEAQKTAFLGDALALLFPVDWPEPFGLCMIEAMACGTPVIAFRCGSVPEVIDEGITGYIVEDIESAVEAVQRARTLDRARCRETFERRFSAERMARDYCCVYESMVQIRESRCQRRA
jgi:glycosyltransferase involved in cell wall biosynthesis